MVRFTLYSRSYCHLCDDMLQALRRLDGEFAFTVDVVDVDADERLVARYDELVPVLLGHLGEGDAAVESGVELCHYFLDESRVRAFLAGA
jgi:thiol-disulfide isomerase/thioredoxin